MLSPSDNPGIFTFLMGLIIVVFAGIGVSLMVDGRNGSLQFSRSIDRDIERNAEEISYMKSQLYRSSDMLEEMVIEHSRNLKAKNAQAASLRLDQLQKSLGELNTEVAFLESSFKNYRSEYIRKSRAAAVGEEIRNLKLRDGREYPKSTILLVTEVGLEIRHEHGISRVQAPDLSQEFQERFQWSDEERRQRLKEEEDRRNAHLQAVLAKSLADRELKEIGNVDEGREKKKLLQTQVKALRLKLANLQREKAETDSLVRYSAQRSVSGSLESVRDKSIRLAKEYSKADTELSIAVANLSQVSPDDPLLRGSTQPFQEQF
jgi:hypothetical protein